MTLWGRTALASEKEDKATVVHIVRTEALPLHTINKLDTTRSWNSKSSPISMTCAKMIETKGQSSATVLVLAVAEVRGDKVSQETKRIDLTR